MTKNELGDICFRGTKCYSVQLTDYSKWRITQCFTEDTSEVHLVSAMHRSLVECTVLLSLMVTVNSAANRAILTWSRCEHKVNKQKKT